MGRKEKRDLDVDALSTALDALDEVHGAVVALALAAGIEHANASELVSPAGDRFPRVTFVLDTKDIAPERGAVSMAARLKLVLDPEDAEVLAFELLREVREAETAGRGEVEIEIGLDGTLRLSRQATPDLRRALREID
jgi:hypothetical protein